VRGKKVREENRKCLFLLFGTTKAKKIKFLMDNHNTKDTPYLA
jgi:hypothetical protein